MLLVFGWYRRRACTADDSRNLFRTMYLQIVRTISSIIESFLFSIPPNCFGVTFLAAKTLSRSIQTDQLFIFNESWSPYILLVYLSSCWYRMSFDFRCSICNTNRIKNLQVHPLFFAFHWNRELGVRPMFHIFTSQSFLTYRSVSLSLSLLLLTLCNETK